MCSCEVEVFVVKAVEISSGSCRTSQLTVLQPVDDYLQRKNQSSILGDKPMAVRHKATFAQQSLHILT